MFKTIITAQVAEDDDLTISALENLITEQKFVPSTNLIATSQGFDVLLQDDPEEQLYLTVNDTVHFVYIKEVRTVPTAYLKERVNEELKAMGELRPSRTKRKQVIDRLHFELLPKMIPKRTRVKGYYDSKLRVFVLETRSETLAEDFLSLVRHSKGGLLTYPIVTTNSNNELVRVSNILTSWLHNADNLPADFSYGEAVTLKGSDSESVTVRNYGIESQEVREYLGLGFKVVDIGLLYKDDIAFMLNDDLILSKVMPLKSEPVTTDSDTTPIDKFKADVIIATADLRDLLTVIKKELSK